VQKLLRETGAKASSPEPAREPEPAAGQGRDDMARLLGELSSLRDELRAALR
jgi:hypothetical protein